MSVHPCPTPPALPERPGAADEEVRRADIHNQMRAGYGVEDIAVRLGLPLDEVRAEAARLAAAGELDGLYRPEIEERRRERDRIEAAAREAVWAARAKSALVARGLTRGRLPCPRCGGTVRLALLGPRRRLSARCDTGRCLRSHE